MDLPKPLPSMLPDNKSAPIYNAEMFAFEESFDYDEFHAWIVRYWTISFVYAAVYLVFIFAGRRYMAKRPRFELRLPLTAWSGLLAVFSIAGAVRTIPELVHLLRWHGFEESVCRLQIFIHLQLHQIVVVIIGIPVVLRRDAPIRQWPIIGRPIIGV